MILMFLFQYFALFFEKLYSQQIEDDIENNNFQIIKLNYNLH